MASNTGISYFLTFSGLPLLYSCKLLQYYSMISSTSFSNSTASRMILVYCELRLPLRLSERGEAELWRSRAWRMQRWVGSLSANFCFLRQYQHYCGRSLGFLWERKARMGVDGMCWSVANIQLSFCLLSTTIIRYKYLHKMTVAASFRATLISINILAGAINTIAYKFQNKQMVFEGPYYKYFFHPYMQAVFMFIGESLSLLVYYLMKRRDEETYKMRMLEAKSKGKQLKINVFLFAIPAAGDVINSTLSYIALNFITGSIWQMFRGGSIVATFVLSICFLKMKVKLNHIVGCGLALVGILIVGATGLIFSDQGSGDASAGQQIFGYALMIISLIATGFIFTYEQKLMSKYHIQPLQMVGYEGLFGLAIELVIVAIMTFLPCSFGAQACVMHSGGMPFFQNPVAYFQQAFSNGILLFFILLSIVSMATFNVTGVTVTKYINALARSIADATRTIAVWIIGIIITVTAGTDKPNYRWELTGAGAILMQLAGFVVLIFGNLIYNRIIKLPKRKAAPGGNPLLEIEDEEEEGKEVTKGPSLLSSES